MENLVAIVSILLVLLVGIISPGPSFILVAQRSIAISRAHGLAAAMGMAFGCLLLACLVLFGLNSIFIAFPALFWAIKILGGLYLIYLAYGMWRSARHPIHISVGHSARPDSLSKSFLIAFGIMIGNPKALIQYGAVFAAMLPAEPTLGFSIGLLLAIFILESTWYILVALVLSSAVPRNAYLRAKSWIDRIAGGVMGFLGLRLIMDGRA